MGVRCGSECDYRIAPGETHITAVTRWLLSQKSDPLLARSWVKRFLKRVQSFAPLMRMLRKGQDNQLIFSYLQAS